MILAAAGLLLVALCFWSARAWRVYAMERGELRWQAPSEPLPADRDGIEAIREVGWSLSDGTRQRALFVPGSNGRIVVVAHGSPGTAVGMLDEGRGLARRGYGVLLLNLPSYGGSEGPRTWGSSFRDAVRAGVDFAAQQPGVRAIAVLGYSMSTAVVTRAAADDSRIRAVVLVAAFTDFPTQRAHQYRSRIPGIAAVAVPAARWLGLAVDELDVLEAIRLLGDRPVLLVAGADDAAIPRWMPRRLKEAAANAEIWEVAGAGHVGLARVAGDSYIDRIDGFLRRNLPSQAGPTGERISKRDAAPPSPIER